ncbi:hypothetical protein ABE82_26880 (plasmid) [Paenibacillus peoriae]|uniref:CD3337/EF1877 family mobilome membrane protein n=1 Tax=Paenibacillus peoriae TaxID=59893 RepID=UPI00071F0B80|nr:EI24 domain-containing protein [Paenibacillus peoriae]ALS10031.1 hypothetical protein ABE82_26880 [Paenibacillus peoriae]
MNKLRNIKRFAALIVLLLFTVFSMTSSSVVHADVVDDLIPTDNSGANYTDPASKYQIETVNPERGALELTEKAKDTTNSVWDLIISFFFMISIYCTKFFVFIAQEAFEFKYFNLIVDVVAEVVQNVTGVRLGGWGNGLWGSFIGVFVQFTIVYVLYLMVKGRFLDGMSSILSFVITLVIILGFFSNLGPFIKGVNGFGQDLNNSLYTSFTSSQTDNSNAGVGQYLNNPHKSGKGGIYQFSIELWTEIVERPYQMMQFGKIDVAPEILKNVLKTEPDSEERTEQLKIAEDKYSDVGKPRTLSKVGIVLMNGLLSGLILFCFCYFAITSLITRCKALYQAGMMSITLFAALFPGKGGGISALQPQFTKLISSLLNAVVAMVFLDLSLVLGHGVFLVVQKFTSSWFVSLFIEAVVIFAGFLFRHDMAAFLVRKVNPQGGMEVPQKKPSVMAYAFKRKISDGIYDRTVGKAFSTVLGGNKAAHKIGVPRKFNPLAMNHANKNVDDATAASMSLRYHNEKETAEQVAASTGEPVQYTPFVSKVNENLENGMKNPFRGLDKEWKAEKERMAAIKADGGNMKDAVLSKGIQPGMNDQQVASVMYGNENSIKQTTAFFRDRPMEALQQIKNAKKLNTNPKVKNAMDDFSMMHLYKRYKQDQRDSVQRARETGEPIQQTPFVLDMNNRFKAAGLQNSHQIRTAMKNSKSREAILPHFTGMPEFKNQQGKLMDANESLTNLTKSNRLTSSTAAVKPVSIHGPLQPKAREQILRQVSGPKVDTIKVPYRAHIAPEVRTDLDMSKVKVNDSKLQSVMRDKSVEVKRLMGAEGNQPLRVVNSKQVQLEQALKIKSKLTSEVTEAIRTEKKSMTINNNSSKVADISEANIQIANKIKKQAMDSRAKATSIKSPDQKRKGKLE